MLHKMGYFSDFVLMLHKMGYFSDFVLMLFISLFIQDPWTVLNFPLPVTHKI